MNAPAEDRILQDLETVMRRTFPDRDYSGPVDASTRLFADLGMASIDMVVLAERLEQFYGRKLSFGPFLSELRKRNASDIEIGALTKYLALQLDH